MKLVKVYGSEYLEVENKIEQRMNVLRWASGVTREHKIRN